MTLRNIKVFIPTIIPGINIAVVPIHVFITLLIPVDEFNYLRNSRKKHKSKLIKRNTREHILINIIKP